ncbi:hypothetical protein VPHK460_0307 [Vibrio phage K460]
MCCQHVVLKSLCIESSEHLLLTKEVKLQRLLTLVSKGFANDMVIFIKKLLD